MRHQQRVQTINILAFTETYICACNQGKECRVLLLSEASMAWLGVLLMTQRAPLGVQGLSPGLSNNTCGLAATHSMCSTQSCSTASFCNQCCPSVVLYP
jgi:hypothetical protein